MPYFLISDFSQYALLLSYFQYCEHMLGPDVPTTVLQSLLFDEDDSEDFDLQKVLPSITLFLRRLKCESYSPACVNNELFCFSDWQRSSWISSCKFFYSEKGSSSHPIFGLYRILDCL